MKENPLLAKHSKASVHYSKGMATSHCGICRHFVPPDACRVVEGKIDPEFWCRMFEKAPKARA